MAKNPGEGMAALFRKAFLGAADALKTVIYGFDGTNHRKVKVDTDGDLQVDVKTVASAPTAATIEGNRVDSGSINASTGDWTELVDGTANDLLDVTVFQDTPKILQVKVSDTDPGSGASPDWHIPKRVGWSPDLPGTDRKFTSKLWIRSNGDAPATGSAYSLTVR